MSPNILLTIVTSITILSGVLSYDKYFVDDASEYRADEEDMEILLRKRSLRVQKVTQHSLNT